MVFFLATHVALIPTHLEYQVGQSVRVASRLASLLEILLRYVFYPKSCKKNMIPSADKSMTYFQVYFGRLNVSFDTVT